MSAIDVLKASLKKAKENLTDITAANDEAIRAGAAANRRVSEAKSVVIDLENALSTLENAHRGQLVES